MKEVSKFGRGTSVKNKLPDTIAVKAGLNAGHIEPETIRSLEEVFTEFQRYNNLKSLAPATIDLYSRNYKVFIRYLSEFNPGGILDITKIRTADIVGYVEHLKDSGLKNTTVNIRLVSVKSIFSFIYRKKYISDNPTSIVPLLKEQKTVGRTIPDDALRKLLKQPDLTTISGIRNHTILMMFADTGMRVGELVDMTISDVMISDGYLVLNRTKNRKYRKIPMTKKLTETMSIWLEVRTSMEPNISNLFITLEKRPITVRYTQYMINDYCKSAGIPNYSPHDFRRRLARTHLMNGTPPHIVQRLLGHSSINQVMEYVSNMETDAMQFIENSSLDD